MSLSMRSKIQPRRLPPRLYTRYSVGDIAAFKSVEASSTKPRTSSKWAAVNSLPVIFLSYSAYPHGFFLY